MAVYWGKHQQAELHAVPFSQYSEIARWSLQLAGEEFQEKSYSPTGLHLKSLTPSSRSLTRPFTRSSSKLPRSGTIRSSDSPRYVAPDGARFEDCWEIVETFVGEIPSDVVELLCCKVGPQVHALFYHFLLSREMAWMWRSVGAPAPVRWWQRHLWSYPGLRLGAVLRRSKAKDSAFVAATVRELDESLGKIERLLLVPGNPFARVNGRPSPAGLVLASLLAPLVDAENYTGGHCNIVRMAGGLGAFPDAFQKIVEECRSRPVGMFVLEMYEDRLNFSPTSSEASAPFDEFDSSPYPGLF